MKRTLKLIARVALACLLPVVVIEGYAGAHTSTPALYSIQLIDGCTISATGKIFPPVFVSNPDIPSADAGSVDITCALNTNYTWGIDKGQNYSAGRRMVGASLGGLMSYTLLHNGTAIGDAGIQAKDAGYTVTTAGVNAVDGIGTGLPQNLLLRADIAVTTSPVADTYKDTVQVVVAW